MDASWQQKLALCWYFVTWSGGIWAWVLMIALLLNPLTTLPTLGYLWYFYGPFRRHVYFANFPTPFRRWRVWRHLAEYFPAKLIKTADLPPDKSYIFGFHPHGILCVSAWIGLATEATDFSEQFPGIDMHVLTLTINLRTPLLAEYLMLHGVSDCSKKTCLSILSRGSGQAVMLAIGGAAESLHVQQGTYQLVLDKRKGFVRIALQAGASLVPVMAFGENDLYTTHVAEEGTWLDTIQKWLMRVLGFTLPIAYGRGLTLGLGLLPLQRPIHIVVGAPIDVPKFEGNLNSPEGVELVNKYHADYVKALRQLWDRHKAKFAYQRQGTLKIVA